MTIVTVDGAELRRGGEPHRILSGALHHFRVHPGQWQRQLRMLHAMGLNTVETYVAWNLHERVEGRFDFTGLADFERFIGLAGDEGLDVIVRPGPYICAEWENGGLPAWLTGRVGTRVRTMSRPYLDAVDRWFDELIPRIARLQSMHGGPVTAVQVENEYGSYGSDAEYLAYLRDGLLSRGIEVPLFTSDGPEEFMLSGGVIPGVWPTANFGSDATGAFETMRRITPGWPLMCMEFWCGWFDHWGDEHTVRDPAEAAAALREILDAGASVNLYTAQGGTNFGPWAGANRGGPLHDGELQPTITSYDYDAPIDERGEPTEKFRLFREELLRVRGDDSDVPAVPEPMPWLEPAEVPLAEVVGSPFGEPVRTGWVPTVEELGIDQGVVVHSTVLRGPRPALPLRLPAFGDRVTVYVDGELAAVGEGSELDVPLPEVPAMGLRLHLVVETMGRVNYGPRVGEAKGITAPVLHERQMVHGWTSWAARLDELDTRGGAAVGLDSGPVRSWGGSFEAPAQGDVRLAVAGVRRGVAWVNGFCLGRFDESGPQTSLYVPWPIVRAGANDVLVAALDNAMTQSSVSARLVNGTGFDGR